MFPPKAVTLDFEFELSNLSWVGILNIEVQVWARNLIN
jgi:hypothetical protein